jgi:hypothetical protein
VINVLTGFDDIEAYWEQLAGAAAAAALAASSAECATEDDEGGRRQLLSGADHLCLA